MLKELVPNVVKEAIEYIGYFVFKQADEETLKFRKDVRENKDELFLTPIKTGDKTWYFGGAGKHNMLFYKLDSGLDTKRTSAGKYWVIYGNENPLVRKTLMGEIEKIKKENGDDEFEIPEKSFEQIQKEVKEFEAKIRPTQEEFPTEFIQASELKQ